MVEGVKNLKEDRRRARQAVAQVSFSFVLPFGCFCFLAEPNIRLVMRDCLVRQSSSVEVILCTRR